MADADRGQGGSAWTGKRTKRDHERVIELLCLTVVFLDCDQFPRPPIFVKRLATGSAGPELPFNATLPASQFDPAGTRSDHLPSVGIWNIFAGSAGAEERGAVVGFFPERFLVGAIPAPAHFEKRPT